MKHYYKTGRSLLLISFFSLSALLSTAQDMVSYAYDQAGNRISRKVVALGSNPSHVQKGQDPAPVEEQLGERQITVYPNPTKGQLGVGITGGDPKDPLRILLFNADGRQLYNQKAESGITSLDMTRYAAGWYVLRVQAGGKRIEYKIIKN
ncbi:MAG TPA: T9SS type A sorting domain-containing protein [Paludibacter sp.]|nr:T9SS type A sorting domain-containing protein [Paludibacter sp.]